MEFETVDYRVEDSVARIAMNRPEKMNALNHRLLDDLDAAFAAAEADDAVRVIVLSGNGRSFCAGYDLNGTYYITPPETEGRWTVPNALRTLRGIEARYQRIWNCWKPTVARVHGHALAAGCYLQLLCDITIAADDAKLGHPAIGIGGGDPNRGGATSMPLWQIALGTKKARYLLMTGRLVNGREAAEMGLVSIAVPAAELDAAVDGVVQDMLRANPGGAMHTKETLNTALEIMGVGAMFRYHGQMNALGRLSTSVSREPDQFDRFRH